MWGKAGYKIEIKGYVDNNYDKFEINRFGIDLPIIVDLCYDCLKLINDNLVKFFEEKKKKE